MCTSKKLSNFEHAVYLRHAFIKIILFIITLGLIYFDFGRFEYYDCIDYENVLRSNFLGTIINLLIYAETKQSSTTCKKT